MAYVWFSGTNVGSLGAISGIAWAVLKVMATAL